jgi:ankyrin repeat protein
MDNIPLMELLLANNANINIAGGHEKMTVLHEAILNNEPNETTIKFLLENGADPQIKYVLDVHVADCPSSWNRNKNGQTASDLALASKKSQLVCLFQNIQCKHASHNDLPVIPPVRRRVRTTSATNVLFFTGFDKSRKESLMKSAQSIFGRKTVSSTKNIENNGSSSLVCRHSLIDECFFQSLMSLLVVKPIALLFEPSIICVESFWANGF